MPGLSVVLMHQLISWSTFTSTSVSQLDELFDVCFPHMLNWNDVQQTVWSGLSRTQTLITQILCLCQEICDIKRQNKYGQQPVPGLYKHWWNGWFWLYLLFSQYTTSPFWTQSWHPITSWNISSIPVFHTASKQSRAACCLIHPATQRYSVINLILSCCFVSRGTIFCVWNPDWDRCRERMRPEPSKGWEVVVGIRIGLGLQVKGGDGGRGWGRSSLWRRDRPRRRALRQGMIWRGGVNPISCICTARALGVGERVKVMDKGKPMISDEMLKAFPKALQLH